MERKRITEMSKGVGKPKVGGPLNLIDHNGNERKDEDWRGKYMLVSRSWWQQDAFPVHLWWCLDRFILDSRTVLISVRKSLIKWPE
jgi:hypothetical protein